MVPGTAEADAVVNRTVSPSMANVLRHMRGWRGYNNPWMAEGDKGE
jgi:ERO1-like protein alpha